MKKTLNDINLNFPHDVYQHIPPDPKRVYLLLHGYLLDGEFMFTKIKDTLPKDCAIIAPNGPLMIPVKKGDTYYPRFSWYFFDPKTLKYYIHFDPAVNYLKQIIKALNVSKLPITIIGYSQGGYLAPKLSEVIDEVDTVIGLACKFRNSKFNFRQSTIYHQIHCEDDLVVDYLGAREEFDELRNRGNLGRMITFSNVGHKLNESYLEELKKLL